MHRKPGVPDQLLLATNRQNRLQQPNNHDGQLLLHGMLEEGIIPAPKVTYFVIDCCVGFGEWRLPASADD